MTTSRPAAAPAALLLALAFAPAARAQDLVHKAPPQQAAVAIVGATVHPVTSEAIEDAAIVFDAGVITYVGPRAGAPAAAITIDAPGRHVWPGLIAPVTQLGLTEVQAVRATLDFDEVGRVSPEVRACVSVNPDSTLLPVTRSNGILLAGVLPAGGLIPGRASVMRLDGWTWEDMTVEPDAALVVQWPFMRPAEDWWAVTPTDEQEKNIRRDVRAIEDAFASARAYADQPGADQPDLRWEAMREFVAPAGGGSPSPVFFLAQDVDQITAALTFAGAHGLRPVIVGGRDALLCRDLLLAHDAPVVLLGTHTFPKRADQPYDDAFTLPARLREAGVRFCIASTDDTAHERNLPYNAALAVAFGLPHDAGVAALTLEPARVLGIADRYGSLEVGKSATLILTDGSPLEITTRTSAAFIDGRQIDLTNKQTELAEKYREKYRQLGLTRQP